MTLWQAKHVSITIGSKITVDANTKLFGQVSTNTSSIASIATDATFTEPENTTETLQLLGNTGTSSQVQNSLLIRNPATDAEFTATLLLSPQDPDTTTPLIDLERFKLTAETAPTDSEIEKRYNYGASQPAAGVAVAIRFQDETLSPKPFVVFLMNDCIVETLGGMTVDAEGQATQEIRIKSAAKDTFKEFGEDTP